MGCLSWLLVLAIAGYIGAHVGQPYFRYYHYRDAISQRIRFAAVRNDADLHKDIFASADSLGLPQDAYNLNMVRDSSAVSVSAAYNDTWSLFNYMRTVPFTIRAEQRL
ncbi:MAG: hypothetical protein ACR2M1_17805 [Gemmatimonadaceae bacterium]